jgi:hypothetical protein
MHNQQKVANAATLFLAYVKGQERPFRQLADYLFMLQSNGWSPTEVEAIQRAIVHEMTKPTFKN